MGDQRRRGGRGRSGRGGRIPRKGEGQAAQALQEAYLSFPLDLAGPLRVAPVVDEAAVERVLAAAVERERRHEASLRALARQSGDPVMESVRAEVEQHRQSLEQLASDLGAEVTPASESDEAESATAAEAAAAEQRSRLDWETLQRAAYASGDRRIDRVVAPALRQKRRHAEVLAAYAVRAAAQGLFRELE